MPLELPENEQKMLLACNGLVRKKPLSFALGTAGSGVLLVLRPRKKDPKAALVKSAYKKALKAMKSPGKLVTWGEAVWDNGKVVFNGEKGFPSGAKKKIREFATEQKLKNFVKVLCKVDDTESEDAPEDQETEEEAQAAEKQALDALEAAKPPIVENPAELEALVEELLQEERAEMAAEISQIQTAVSSVAPPDVASRAFDDKIEQIRSFGAPEEMLPATLEVFIELCEALLGELPADHDDIAEMEGLLKAAVAAQSDTGAALTPAQEKAWTKLQGSAHYTAMQMPALIAYLRGSDDEILRQIGASGEIQASLSFLGQLRSVIQVMGRAPNEEAARSHLAGLRSAKARYDSVKTSERFQVLGKFNPFPVPLPLLRLGDEIQALLDTF